MSTPCSLFLDQKGIIGLFRSHRRFGAMTRIHNRFIRQHKQFFPYTLDQRFEAATRQVGAANALAEQYVAAQNELLGPAPEADMAGRMTRCKQYLQLIIT